MAKKQTVLIIDDHPLFRQGLASFLSRLPGYELVGESGEGAEGIRKAKELTPDMVFMDISLPDMSGIEATRQIRETLSGARVVILSIHAKIDYITSAFKAGASAYLTKESTGEQLAECLKAVSRGEFYLDAAVSHKVVTSLLMGAQEKQRITNRNYAMLTAREEEILKLIAEGFSSKQVGEKLFISQKTVENHRASIFGKLNIHSTMELVRYAVKHGIIDVDRWMDSPPRP